MPAMTASTITAIQTSPAMNPIRSLKRMYPATRSTAIAMTLRPRSEAICPMPSSVAEEPRLQEARRAGRQVAVQARKGHGAHHPAGPEDLEVEAPQAIEQPPRVGCAEHPERLRLLLHRHPVERREHDRHEVLG